MNMWLLIAISVLVVFVLFRTGRGIYYGRKNSSKYGKFTPKKKG
jgi:hypothetical protein